MNVSGAFDASVLNACVLNLWSGGSESFLCLDQLMRKHTWIKFMCLSTEFNWELGDVRHCCSCNVMMFFLNNYSMLSFCVTTAIYYGNGCLFLTITGSCCGWRSQINNKTMYCGIRTELSLLDTIFICALSSHNFTTPSHNIKHNHTPPIATSQHHHRTTPPHHSTTAPPPHPRTSTTPPHQHHTTAPPHPHHYHTPAPPLHRTTTPPHHHSTAPPLRRTTTPPHHHIGRYVRRRLSLHYDFLRA